jgi:hypothetical protein
METKLTKENFETYNKQLRQNYSSVTYNLNEKIKNYSDSIYSYKKQMPNKKN